MSIASLINVITNQMGYDPVLEQVSKFHKPNLPSGWNLRVTICLRCFAVRTKGSDNASKLMFTLFYALYNDIKIDNGQTTEALKPKKKKIKKALKPRKTPLKRKLKQKPTLQDELIDDEETESEPSHHSDRETEKNINEGTSNPTKPESIPKDTTYDNLENIVSLTQTPPIPPKLKKNKKMRKIKKRGARGGDDNEDEEVDEDIEMDTAGGDLVDIGKISKQEQMVKEHVDDIQKVKKTIVELVDFVQSKLKNKIEGLERKIDELKNVKGKENGQNATMHAQELKIKELET
ncbi:hypothetical protein LXL04_008002 [Taraxacum kok-saghyz]